MTDEIATLAVRALVALGAAGVLGRWLVRLRADRAQARSLHQYQPLWSWFVVVLAAVHPIALATPTWYDALLRPAGILLMVAGLALAGWATVHLGRYWDVAISALPDHRVVDDGPFAMVRHPIYLGLVGFVVGATGAVADPLVAFAAAVEVAVLVARARAEERFLTERLGEGYAEYARRVPMLLPWPRP